MAKTATYYNAGRLSGDEADLFMFTCWNESRTGCGCHSVYSDKLQANIEALQRNGYTVENLDARPRNQHVAEPFRGIINNFS